MKSTIKELCGAKPDLSLHTGEVVQALELRQKFYEAELKWNFSSRGRIYERASRITNSFYSGRILWRGFWDVGSISLIFFAGLILIASLPGTELGFKFLSLIFLAQTLFSSCFALIALSFERKISHKILEDSFFKVDFSLHEVADATALYILKYLTELKKEEKGQCRLVLGDSDRIVLTLYESIKMLETEASALERLLSFRCCSANSVDEAERLYSGARYIVNKLRGQYSVLDNFYPNLP